MTKDSVRTREEELYYASCPICSTTLLQAETVLEKYLSFNNGFYIEVLDNCHYEDLHLIGAYIF